MRFVGPFVVVISTLLGAIWLGITIFSLLPGSWADNWGGVGLGGERVLRLDHLFTCY
jgi:hypothetical protein